MNGQWMSQAGLQGLAVLLGAVWAASPGLQPGDCPLHLCPWSSTGELSNVTVPTWSQGGPGCHCEMTFVSPWLLFLLRYI